MGSEVVLYEQFAEADAMHALPRLFRNGTISPLTREIGFVILRKCFTALRFFSSLLDVKTTMICTYVLNRGGREGRSPVDGR